MILKWLPLPVRPDSSPEEAFLAAAKVSGQCKAVMLAWTHASGWGGCYAVEDDSGNDTPPRVIHLMNVGDSSIVAVRKVEKIILPREVN